jgi:hypothetical protein
MCAPCTHNCNQGRACPARKSHPFSVCGVVLAPRGETAKPQQPPRRREPTPHGR